MKLAVIGVGQAGGKITDALLAYDDRTDTASVRAAVAVNTARADLLGLERIPLDRRVLIGQDRVKGHGVGADNELGTDIARDDVGEVLNAVDDIPTHDVDAFLVIAGLGGGTGSGAAPVITRELKRIYTEPVYGVGALPSNDEGGIYTLNAARSFQTFVREADNVVVFDNDAWRLSGESVKGGYDRLNEELARRLGVLFSAGEATEGVVPESVVDASEVINTLGSGGISTIGYAATGLNLPHRGLFDRLSGVEPEVEADPNRIVTTVRKATLGRLTLPCEIDSAERALVVVAGPPKYIDRKGVERATKWLEEATGTMEVRGGDYPIPKSEYVAAVVVLSGVTDVPRVRELQRVAIETQQNLAEIRKQAPEALARLVRTGDEGGEELDPLF